jgi:toxin-antitoxin system PIN domain toxin
VILVDANLLIYAVNADSHHHRAARRWLEETMSGTTPVGLAWIVLLAFLRITTRPGVLQHPITPDRALDYVDSWLRQPYVTAVVPGDHHWSILRNLLRAAGTAGNLTSDAHLAALAIELGAPIYSTDNDFRRFQGVEHINPLAGA